MRILFGPEHDSRQSDPNLPGAYEWWYFDALSDDGCWVFVAIFFLGSPMSPYYKAVADGQKPSPQDWCGVFVSLHEKVGGRWLERTYAYNLYRGGTFSATIPFVSVGDSTMIAESAEDGRQHWHLSVKERGLWRGHTRADLMFTTVFPPPKQPSKGSHDAADHTWVCVAPECRVEGFITPASGSRVTFAGNGYHDHNFGQLPWRDTNLWYWARALLQCNDGQDRTAIVYYWEAANGEPSAFVSFTGQESQTATVALEGTERGRYGLRYRARLVWEGPNARGTVDFHDDGGVFADSPFYRRVPVTVTASGFYPDGMLSWQGSGTGIGEIFQPARLCGPIASRALWTRLRRRQNPQ